jgi:hypothetical protein
MLADIESAMINDQVRQTTQFTFHPKKGSPYCDIEVGDVPADGFLLEDGSVTEGGATLAGGLGSTNDGAIDTMAV